MRKGAVEVLWPYCGGSAEDALDALCDYLTEHRHEWVDDAGLLHKATACSWLGDLLAVLRESSDA